MAHFYASNTFVIKDDHCGFKGLLTLTNAIRYGPVRIEKLYVDTSLLWGRHIRERLYTPRDDGIPPLRCLETRLIDNTDYKERIPKAYRPERIRIGVLAGGWRIEKY